MYPELDNDMTQRLYEMKENHNTLLEDAGVFLAGMALTALFVCLWIAITG